MIIKVKFGDKMLGAIFKSSGPIQSKPVAFEPSKEDKYVVTNQTFVNGILQLASLGILKLT